MPKSAAYKPRPIAFSLSAYRSALAVCAAVAMAGGTSSRAASVTWSAGSGTDFLWDTTANWNVGVKPAISDDVLFPTPVPNPGNLATPTTITLGFGEGANSLAFNDTYTLTGGDLTIGAGGVTVAFGATGTINSSLAGSSGLTLTSSGGTLVLGGTNSFTGPVNVNSGLLRVTNVASLGDQANVANVSAGATLQVVTAAAATLNNSVVLNGGTFSHNGANQMSVATGKSITIGAAGGTLDVGQPFPASAGKILLSAGQLTGTGALTKTGAGVVQLSGANTGYTGGAVTINGGFLEFQNVDALGGGVDAITINSGGEFISTGVAVRHNFTLNSGATISANSNANGDYQGTINVAGNATAALRFFQGQTTANSFKISGPLTGNGNLSVTAPAAATLTLSGDNSAYTGKITIATNATVQPISKASLLTGGSSGGYVLAGGTLRNNVANVTDAPTAGAAGLTATYYNFGSNPGTGSNAFATDLLLNNGRAITRVDADINIPNNGSGTFPVAPVVGFGANTNHGVMWKGLLNIAQAGSYQFSGINDDNAVLYIDGQQIGTLGVNAASTNIGGAVNLTAGQHSITYKFTQGTGGGYTVLNYSGTDTAGSVVRVGSVANTLTSGSLAATDIGTVTVTANSTLDLGVDSTSSSLTLSGGALTITSPTISTYTVTGPSTITANTTLAPTTAALVMNGGISGTGNLTISGPYLTTLNASNSFTGSTSVTGGEVDLNSAAGDAIPGNLTVNASNSPYFLSNVRLLRSNQIADGSTVTLTSGVLDLGANNETVTGLVLNGGRLSGTGTLTTTNAPDLQSGYIGATLAGNNTITKTTAGTVVLAATNTFQGALNVNGGVLRATGTGSLGAGGAGNQTTVAAGAQLQLAGANNSSENVTINGTGAVPLAGASTVLNDGAIRNVSGASTIGSLTLGSDSTIHVDSGELIINGPYTKGTSVLTKSGSGALTFATNQSTLPAVNFTGGALGFSGPQSFGAATVPAGLAYRFDTDPGAGVTITVPNNTAIIAGYAASQSLISRLAATSTGSLLLTADSSNPINLSAANVGLGALGLVNQSGVITPNAGGYKFSSLAGQGGNVGQNELTVSSVLSGNNGVSVTGGLVYLSGQNTFKGPISLTGGITRVYNGSALGDASNVIDLNGGTLQLVSNTGNAGAISGILGNGVNGTARSINIGALGGTIDKTARTGGDNGYILGGSDTLSPITGSGTLTMTGLGRVFLTNPATFSGGLVLSTGSSDFDVRANGSLPNVASITINQSARLVVDNASGLGSRQFTSTATSNRINDAAPIVSNGGAILYRPKGAAAPQNGETFGTLTLGIGQSSIGLDSNASGTTGGILTFGTFTRATGSTVLFNGTSGTYGAGTAATPGANNSQVLFGGLTASSILPFASIQSVDLAAYDAAVGVKIATYTAQGAATFAPVAANIYNLNAAGTAILSPGDSQMLGLRFGSGNNAQVLAFDSAAQKLAISSGAIIHDNNNQNRDIGTATVRGVLTAGPLTGNSQARELFLHSQNGTLRIFSTVTDNNAFPVSVVKDLDGTAILDAPNNTYSGGTYVLRGTLTASAAGSLGTGNATVSNSRLQMTLPGAIGGTGTITVMNNGEVNLNNGGQSWTTAGDRYVIQSGSVILGGSSTTANLGLNSLTRVAGAPVNGGEVQIAPDSIVGHFNFNNNALNGTGVNTIKNLGTAADLFYGLSLDANAGNNQSITIGSGTPWKGLSTDRNSRRWSQGTIYANSDFYMQGMIRDSGAAALSIGSPNAAGTFAIVNQAGQPINGYLSGQVIFDEDTPSSMPGDLTLVATPQSIVQFNRSGGLGLLGGTTAKVLVQAGGVLDPGNFTNVGAAANQPFGMPYPLPSPLNGKVTVETGGRFVANDPSGLGSAPVGSWLLKDGSILDIGNANVFLGSGNSLYANGATNTGLINDGQLTFEKGAIVRLQVDNIYRRSQFIDGATNGQNVTYELFNGNRVLTQSVNPFVATTLGTSLVIPEDATISGGGMITNDLADRQLSEGRGKLVLGDGAVLAATTQTYLNIQEGIEIKPNATITIGSTKMIDGLPKLGSVQLNGGNSNVIPASAKVVMLNGTQLTFGAQNVWSDSAPLDLPFAVTAFPTPGAQALQPGNGTSLLLNSGNFAEVIGPLTGNGAVMANTAGTTLAAGWGATTDYSFNGVIKSTNGQNPAFWKVGATKMSMTGVSDSTGDVAVYQGELAYSGAGGVVAGNTGVVRVGKGGTLTFDDSASSGASNRLANRSVAGQGGTISLIGGASPVTETITLLNNGGTPGGSTSFINVTPGAGTTTLNVTTMENFNTGGRQSTWVLRGPTLSNQPGTFSASSVYTPNAANLTNGRIVFSNPNFISNGAFGVGPGGTITGAPGTPVVPTRPDLLGDPSGTGQGVGFVTEDGLSMAAATTSGSPTVTVLNPAGLAIGMPIVGAGIPLGTTITDIQGGTLTLSANATATSATVAITVPTADSAMRLLTDSEYSNSLRINQSVNLNVKLSGAQDVTGDTRVQTLTLKPGTTVNINGTLPLNATPSRLLINGSGLLVQSGGAGSTINGSYLQVTGGTSAYLHTQGDLAMNATLFSDTGVVKTGNGTLNFGAGAASLWRGTLVIDGGAVNLGANNSFFTTRGQNGFTGQSLVLNGGVLNLNGNSQLINGLNTANPLVGTGGTLTSATPANVSIQGGGSFTGSIGGAISLDKLANNTLLLTNDNPYTGNTTIRSGTIQLRDQGRLSGTGNLDLTYGTLLLDNGYLANVDNRVSPTATVNSRGGTISLVGAAAQVARQSFGTVNLVQGLTTINSNAGGSGANEITFGNLVHSANSGTMINFNQNYGFLGTAGNTTTALRDFLTNVNGAPVNLTNGIIGGWAIANGDHFATYSTATGVSSLSNTNEGFATYGSVDLSTASATTNTVNVNDGTSRTIPAGSVVNAIRNAPGAAQTLTLAGGLTIASGGLLTNANQTITYTGGTLTSGSEALYTWINQGTTNINSQVTGAIDLVKGGGATLGLGAANTYTGKTFVDAGTLNVGVTGADGNATVAVPGDLLIHNATTTVTVANSIKATSNVTITGSGRLNLANTTGITETLASITFLDAGGTSGTMNIDRTAAQTSSVLNLTAPAAITATNTNPNTVPFFGSFLGVLGFTNSGAQTIKTVAPVTNNGLAAVGLRIDAQISTVPNVAEGGLIKTGNGILALNPTNTGAVNFGSALATYDGTLASLKDVVNVSEGILRTDIAGGLGTNSANTTVQSGAGLLYRNVTATGSVKLKAGSFLAPVEGSAVIGVATGTVNNQTVLNVAGNTTLYATDYFVQGTNTGNITVNGRLTGSGNINLMGVQITQGNGAGGALILANPITTGAGSNDYTGAITANVNTVLQSQRALLTGDTSTTGSTLAGASIVLNGGRLRLRDDFSLNNSAQANQTASYGNNVTLLADSFLDANRTSSNGGTINNIINLGTLTVPSGSKTLNVDSGSGYQVGFDQLSGAGTLVKGGNAILNINSLASTFTGSITVAGPQGLVIPLASGLNLNAPSNNLQNLTVNGVFSPAAGTLVNVANVLSVGNNAGAVTNGMNGVSTGSVTGALAVPTTATLTFGPAGILRNDGVIGSTGGNVYLTPAVVQGSGLYQTVGQTLTVGGQLADNGASPTRFKVAGDSTVSLTSTNSTNTGGAEIQSGILRITPAADAFGEAQADAINPLGTGAGGIRVVGSPSTLLDTNSQPVNAVAGTLQFDSGTHSITQAGNITNNGLVYVRSGTTTVAGVVSGTPITYVPGLLEGRLNSSDLSSSRLANPGNFGIKLEPRMGQNNLVTQNPLTGWSDNDQWVYTGQFFDADGTFTFAENIDDVAMVSIDGVTRLLNTANGVGQPVNTGAWVTVTSTATTSGQNGQFQVGNANTGTAAMNFGMGANNDGWHTIEIRFRNGAGGAGPAAANGFAANFGFGLNKNGTTALDGAVFERPIDPGDGSLFRTAVGGAGQLQVDAGASLKVGGFQTISDINLSGGLKTTGAIASSSAENLNVFGAASLDVKAGTSVSINTLTNVLFGNTLSVNGSDAGVVKMAATKIEGNIQVLGGRVEINGAGDTNTSGTGLVSVTGSNTQLAISGSIVGSVQASAGVVSLPSGGAIRGQFGTGGNATFAGSATLQGAGQIDGMLQFDGGTLSPGNNGINSTGVLSVGSLDLTPVTLSNVIAVFDVGRKNPLQSPVAGTDYDELVVGAGATTFDVTGANLSINIAGTMVKNDIFTLIVNNSSLKQSSSGGFAGLANGATFTTVGGYEFKISYFDDPTTAAFETDPFGTGRSVSLFVTIPEPSSAAAVLCAASALLGGRRFRRRRA